MLMTNEEHAIIKRLIRIYQEKGFVSENTVLNEIIEASLSLDKIDYVCDKLLSAGIIISDGLSSDINDEEEVYDRSQIDYESLFNKVIGIDENLKQFISEIRQIKPPQYRELQNLIPQAKDYNLFARERIVNMYLRTVVKIALWHHKKYKVPLAEAIQDGCVGLVIALNKFQLYKQDNFSTYAPWWVRQNIYRESPTINTHVYFPAHMKEKLFSIYEVIDEHYCEQCEENILCNELIKKVSEKLSCNDEHAKECINFLQRFESVEHLLEQDESFFCDKGEIEEEMIENYNKKELKRIVSQTLSTFKEREEKIIKMRFGFINEREHTLEEIGNEVGVTRERIRQIEKKILRKLRHPSRSKKLKAFL